MKRIILLGLLGSTLVTALGQGTIDFINRGISTAADPTVLYNTPIFRNGGRLTGIGAGNLSGRVTIGLFLEGAYENATPIISTPLRTGTSVQAQFFAFSPQRAVIPGVAPGEVAHLLVRAWQGADFGVTFAQAKQDALQWAEWSFTSQPLGGTTAGGQTIATPGMTGWGREDGVGFELNVGLVPATPPPETPEPGVVALLGCGALAFGAARRPGRCR